MHNWDDLKYCLALKRYGTMSGAAQALKTNVATVSRRIHGLSEELGIQLFVKDGQKWKATPFAESLAELAESTDTELSRIRQEGEASSDPKEVRINYDEMIRQSRLMSAVSNLFETVPNITFKLRFGSASLGFGETDIFLTTIPLEEGNLVQKRVGTLRSAIWCGSAHQDRLESWIRVEGNTSMEEHHSALLDEMGEEHMILNDGLLCAEVIQRAPFAAALVEDYAVRQRGLRFLPQFAKKEHAVWAYFHATRRQDKVIHVALDWIAESFKAKEEALAIPAKIPDLTLKSIDA
ncbi:LysR family transcriptional regulator [Donghicola sp. C2-DW-16]|uniref:LysR family transcriptional regulator n=1 Tax=Donghicola mangrovi TaxID=2729614 RepID=A0ABX2PAX6_9RHOB|nr:LysR family transcriptional regulator [Donghicola mangrovi]NVO26634.1 LysR family transcriptional regulator [Donghicola mangrovi]